jgi:hypothetical protein
MIARTVPVGTVCCGSTRIRSTTPLTVPVDQPLLGLDLRDDVTARHPVARLLAPCDQGAGRHVGAEDWHEELSHRA